MVHKIKDGIKDLNATLVFMANPSATPDLLPTEVLSELAQKLGVLFSDVSMNEIPARVFGGRKQIRSYLKELRL